MPLTKTLQTWAETHVLPRFNPKFQDLSDHTLIKDRDVAVKRIVKAIRDKERIVLFGDFDNDGLTSTVILTEVIRKLGGTVIPLNASRFDGGYGFSERGLERALAHRPDLLITLDCGSSDADRLAKLSCDAIVIDHHLVPEKPLPVIAFLNPHRPDCPSTYKHLATCGLAFSVAVGLKRELNADIDPKQWLDLVAIGTIADVMPLTGDNRILVHHGMKMRHRDGLNMLYAVAGMPDGPTTGRDIAFRVAPLINAPGRLGGPDIIKELLMADEKKAISLAYEVKALSDTRRQLTEEILSQALPMVDPGYPSIVVGDPSWNHGIVGIVAARLSDKFGRPAIVVGHGGTGSVRGPKGSRLYDALVECKDLLVGFGGHQAAAGVKVEFDKIPELQKRFAPVVPDQEEQQFLQIVDDPRHVLRDMTNLEPCGMGNERPALKITGSIESIRVMKEIHAKIMLRTSTGHSLSCFAPGMAAALINQTGQISLIGDLRSSKFCDCEFLVTQIL